MTEQASEPAIRARGSERSHLPGPPPGWQKHLQRVEPMSAGLAVQATVDVNALPIGRWQGLGVLVLLGAARLLAGGLLLEMRDAC